MTQNHLKTHFLNVSDNGMGDCTIIELPDNEIMMIDIRNGRSDNTHNRHHVNPIHYLNELNCIDVYRYIQTHPDMDHLDGLHDLINKFNILNFWDVQHERKKPDEFNEPFRETDWDAYIAKNNTRRVLNLTRKSKCVVSDQGGYNYEIYAFSPTLELVNQGNRTDSWNDLSYIVLLQYGYFKILFGGDASEKAWDDLRLWLPSDAKACQLLKNITVFKASHHGRKSGYCGDELLDFLNPNVIICDDNVDYKDSAYAKYENFLEKSRRNLYSIGSDTVIIDYDKINNTYKKI